MAHSAECGPRIHSPWDLPPLRPQLGEHADGQSRYGRRRCWLSRPQRAKGLAVPKSMSPARGANSSRPLSGYCDAGCRRTGHGHLKNDPGMGRNVLGLFRRRPQQRHARHVGSNFSLFLNWLRLFCLLPGAACNRSSVTGPATISLPAQPE